MSDSVREAFTGTIAFLLTTFIWLLLVGIVSGIAAVALSAGSVDVLDPTSLMSPGLMGSSALIQATGLGLIALLLARLLHERPLEAIVGQHMWWGWGLAATIGGVTIGFFPGWIANRIVELLPILGGTLEMLTDALKEPAPVGKTLLVLAICVAAPIGEELAFRGFLWSTLKRAMPEWSVWLLTSLMFAGYHLDPVQSISLVPTALFLGWLRWKSGSVVAPIIGHFVNNALAATAMLMASDEAPAQIGIVFALGSLFVSVLACAVAGFVQPRENA